MKKQIKKSLSLFLAVLMLMTSWVWVAPEKAEAGAPTSYDVVVTTNADNMNPCEDTHRIVFYHRDGTQTDKNWANAQNGVAGDETFTMSKWPYKLNLKVGSKNVAEVRVTQIKINGVVIFSGGYNLSATGGALWESTDEWNLEAGGNQAGQTTDWKDPYLATVTPVLSTDSISLDKVNTGNSKTATLTLTNLLDQYGVNYSGTVTPSFSISTDDAIIESGHASIETSGKTATVTIKPWFQTLFPEKSGAKLYVKWDTKVNGKDGTETINIDFPGYSATFDGNGGKIGTNDSEALDTVVYGQKYAGKACYNETYKDPKDPAKITHPRYLTDEEIAAGKCSVCSSSAYLQDAYEGDPLQIGGKIGKAPSFNSRPGFEFKGFYSKKNDDAFGRITSFSGTKFEDNKTLVPHTANADNGYDPDSSVVNSSNPFYGDTVWFAAWQSAPVNATFITADNQLIGTVEGRYGNYLTSSNMYGSLKDLNTAVRASHTTGKVNFNGDNEPIYKDGSTTYTFAGWKIIKAYDDSLLDLDETAVLEGDVTFQAVYTKASAQNYTVQFKNNNGDVFDVKYDYKYRDQIVLPSEETLILENTDKYSYEFIGWAKHVSKNYYTVDANDMDEDGAKIVYTSKDSSEFIVKGDVTYVPVYRMTKRNYTVTFNYTLNDGVPATIVKENCHWDDPIELPAEIGDNYTAGGQRYYLTDWKVGTANRLWDLKDIIVEGNMVLTAVYGKSEPAEYTINFYGKAEDGETDVLLNADNNIYKHNDVITAPAVPGSIETEDSLYKFSAWSPAINPDTNEVIAAGDKDYYAIYTKKDYADIHFYNHDGTLIYELAGKENGFFKDETIIPEYENIVDGENVLPTREEDVIGTYVFTGWKNSAGEVVVPGTDMFTGDTYLYAQYDTVYTEYRVRFVDDDGTLISTAKYRYGEDITVPANPTKAADIEYIYDFRAWTPSVSETCRGEATYVATYRRTQQYYKVTWLDDSKNVLTESNYPYNGKINQATIDEPTAKYDAPTGQEWAFDAWIQCDASGRAINAEGEHVEESQAVKFYRGQRMGGENLYFYPTFKTVPSKLTVTFYKEDGTTLLGTAKVPYGDNLVNYADTFAADAIKGYTVTATHHSVVDKWVNIADGTAVTAITADVSVKASVASEAHEWDNGEVTVDPTCNIPGYADYRCTVSGCTYINTNVAIAPLADESAPTGQLYVGSDKWSSADYANGIDYSDVKYVGPETQLVVNAKDTGTASSPYNEDGSLARGVGKIEYALTKKSVNPSTITKWTEIYNSEAMRQDAFDAVLREYKINLVEYNSYIRGTAEQKMKKAEIDRAVDTLLSSFNANATSVVSNLNLEEGEKYVIYIRITDREGNGEVNTSYLSSGTISYGTKAPVIEVTGEGYSAKFCEEANIRITDDNDGLQVYLDGEAVSAYTNPGTTSANGTFVASFKTTEKGAHTVTVIDKNGNKSTKNFEIKGNHTYRNYIVAETCTDDGLSYNLCSVCGNKEVIQVRPAKGHDYNTNYIDKDATCVENGYRTYVCNNNCGTKLVVKPTDDAALLAQAKIAVDPEAEEIEWRDLTAEDLKHLVATKVHTYEKVKDENGEDTDEDIWVVDKAATCKAEGSMHKDCIKCGETVTAVIPVDSVNGHKFYREKITTEPTCTEMGAKTKTCRYCNEVVKVEDIEALGHTDGEYRVVLEATCTEKGSKILTCATCGADLGAEIETDAIDHAWKVSGGVYEEDGKYYQNYVCKNDSNHTKREEVADYEPPVAATVTFNFGKNGGYYVVPAVGSPNEFGYVPEAMKGTQKVNAYVGETISADEVATALKADTATKTFKFSHWEDAEGKEVKFPIEVKGDATFYAVYSEKYVNYTIIYYTESTNANGTVEYKEVKKVGYLHNGQEVELLKGPSKAETNLETYEFAGWTVYGSNPEVVYTDKVTIDGANISLVAKYTAKAKKFAVTYAYSKSDILETFSVNAGSEAKPCAITPEKAYDVNNHYEFDGWNRAAQLAKVESNIYTTPNFKAIPHSYVVTEKTPATCSVNKVETYTCSCGYTFNKEVSNSALEHNWGTPVYDAETGKNVITCSICNASETDTRSFTVKFFVNATDAKAIKTISYITWGTTIDATRLPATPSKESTATTDYTFKGWAVKGDATETVIDFTKYTVKADAELVAVFTGTTREYSVVFAYDASNVIKVVTGVKAGSSVTFDGAKPVKAFDNNYHYAFTNWQGYAAGAEGEEQKITITDVQSDLKVYADFAKTAHEYDNGTPIGTATCTQGIGTRYTCTGCAKFYDVSGKPLDHDFSIEIDRKDATLTEEGYIVYKCATCPEGSEATYTEKIQKLESTITYINVKVEDSEGKPLAGASVDLYIDGKYDQSYTTNIDGEVNLAVEKGYGYSFLVEYDGKDITGGLKAAELGEDKVNTVVVNISKCSCACHGDGIWSAIFRFFHKMIKMFTGEFKCCNDPDARYN